MKKRMSKENRRDKYIRIRVNEDELKEFNICCSMLETNKSDLVRNAIISYLKSENLEIWK